MPLISICIPAYKNADYLSRLLDSITKQDFKDFEIIITDDSPDDILNILIKNYEADLNIIYIKNQTPLGSPSNWNFGISRARGEWIKIMHDDDWFTNETSLSSFANIANKTNTDFIFSGFYEEDIQTKKTTKHITNQSEEQLIKRSPYNLLKKNYIGHPSTTLIRNNQKKWFNENLKWVVDIEFYIRLLNSNKSFVIIKKPLVTIGINPLQITKQVFRDPAFEIPENLVLLQLNPELLKHLYAYDYYWRLLRNLSIRNISELEKYKQESNIIPDNLKRMLSFQKKFPLSILKNGIISKFLMTASFFFNPSTA